MRIVSGLMKPSFNWSQASFFRASSTSSSFAPGGIIFLFATVLLFDACWGYLDDIVFSLVPKRLFQRVQKPAVLALLRHAFFAGKILGDGTVEFDRVGIVFRFESSGRKVCQSVNWVGMLFCRVTAVPWPISMLVTRCGWRGGAGFLLKVASHA
jgi:hypothetical protein